MIIDIRAKVLPDNCRAWRLFPGRGYRFRDEFLNRNVGFLELPNLRIAGDFPNDPHRYAKVYAALRLADLKNEIGNEGNPTTNWRDYVDVHIDQTLGRVTQAATNFYFGAAAGDIVIAPDHKSRNQIFIGVIRNESTDRHYIEDVQGYNRYTFPARAIDWMPAISETTLSPSLSRSLRHEHAFGLLSADMYNEAFSLAYGNFIGNGVYSSIVANGNNDFTDGDNALIGVIFTLAAYACEAQENGAETFEVDDVFDFFFNRPPVEYACYFSSEHHSPGFTRYLGGKPTALVAVGAIAALLAMGADAQAAGRHFAPPPIQFTNSLSGDGGPCDPKIEEAQQILFRSINGDKLRKACQKMLETNQRARLGTRSRVVRRGN